MKRGSQKMLVCQNVHRELSRLSLSATSPTATTLPPCINGVWIWKSKICNLQSSCQLQPPSRPMYKWSGCTAGLRTKKEIASEMNCLGWECMQGPQLDSLASLCVCLARRRPWTTPRNVQAVQTLSGTHLITRVTKTPHISATDPCVQKEIAFVVAWQRLTKLLSEAL